MRCWTCAVKFGQRQGVDAATYLILGLVSIALNAGKLTKLLLKRN
ncbi:hypothetical protein Y11_14341 [Yersinia enterocolitica subsp. palearctica Y11]|uniref:Uncharacterized protein n=1 Tax=Yersinia enterocolitica subsp. palearctica serotype O:3 (strain DSM 13030 / CIP 106945 / Y11) TaxID=930944 RepID=A0A0H3NTX1_YERE1|nr:hypothetical protein FORC065_1730 [Yersinia enterocolitica]UXD29970.1 hypothetical protein FORC066_2761 [Yersinia enterocolitica]CBY26747.1 hypothetical protein Y11_14341 [Yersinia enterocolitica subsp. palearctica Y11]CCO67685.1 hypothetical protein D322_789 [Yersinia enterocolitica IP 10393]